MKAYEVVVNGNKLGWDHVWLNRADAQKEVEHYRLEGLAADVVEVEVTDEEARTYQLGVR